MFNAQLPSSMVTVSIFNFHFPISTPNFQFHARRLMLDARLRFSVSQFSISNVQFSISCSAVNAQLLSSISSFQLSIPSFQFSISCSTFDAQRSSSVSSFQISRCYLPVRKKRFCQFEFQDNNPLMYWAILSGPMFGLFLFVYQCLIIFKKANYNQG